MKLAGKELTRATRVEPGRTALLVVNLQNAELSERMQREHPEFVERVRNRVVPNVQQLLAAARSCGAEVIYTTIESLTRDGRDRSLDHKLSKLHEPKGSWGAKVLAELAPGDDEIVLPKTSSGVFNSTTLDYILRNIGIEAVIVTGVLTDQCVNMAIRDGADRGYFMICAADACTSYSESRHDAALRAFGGYCRTSTSAELVEELTGGD